MEALKRNDFVQSDSLFDLFLNKVHYRLNTPMDLGGLSGNIAYSKMALRKLPEAEAFAKNELLFNSRSYLGYLVLGITNFAKGNLKIAKNNLTIAARLNPKDVLAKQYLQRIQ
jgi:hypothetical protein